MDTHATNKPIHLVSYHCIFKFFLVFSLLLGIVLSELPSCHGLPEFVYICHKSFEPFCDSFSS